MQDEHVVHVRVAFLSHIVFYFCVAGIRKLCYSDCCSYTYSFLQKLKLISFLSVIISYNVYVFWAHSMHIHLSHYRTSLMLCSFHYEYALYTDIPI